MTIDFENLDHVLDRWQVATIIGKSIQTVSRQEEELGLKDCRVGCITGRCGVRYSTYRVMQLDWFKKAFPHARIRQG